MAETRGVWGIDIGQAGLKAIRLRYAEAAQQVLAVAFDYVPHPKILSQPDAVPDELIAQALQTFLSRNDVKGDAVCISVPGQSALARFIQLPPVEKGKVADIVKYEAKQQIPFALEDVIWDYQTLGSGSEEGGFLLEAEVGLFAMKKEQVHQHLRPFTNARVEVEVIQIAPLALYNLLFYDQLGLRLEGEERSKEDYTIILDMGADNTTLLVSNGAKIWIRNVPIGGNHFTRALTKEMKLTFAKAEHTKCNATKTADPRAVFQVLRPVFNDYVAEIQRSIGYFSSVNRDAKITRVLGLGNGFKLAGLQKFLQQNLQYQVDKLESFPSLVGDTVLNAPLFQENILSFGVAYGLALQGLAVTRIHTTLLPQEIANARKIRRKKPWAALTAASLLFGLSLSAAGYGIVAGSVSEDRFGGAETKVKNLQTEISGYQTNYNQAKTKNEELVKKGDELVGNVETREYWMEVYKAINQCLPRDVADDLDETDITKKKRIKINSITCRKVSDLGAWFQTLPDAAKGYLSERDRTTPPQGAGYVFVLEGAHYHHDEKDPRHGQGRGYVMATLLKNLQSWTVEQPQSEAFPVGKLGISHATLIRAPQKKVTFDPVGHRKRDVAGGGVAFPGGGRPDMGVPGVVGGAGIPREADPMAPVRDIDRTDFTLTFLWTPTPRDKRAETPPEAASEQAGGQPAPAGGAPANPDPASASSATTPAAPAGTP